MATTVALANQPTVAVDVALKPFTQANFLPTGEATSEGGRVKTSTYVLNEGANADQTIVTIRSQYDPKTEIYRTSLTVKTNQVVTKDTVVVEEDYVEVGLFWNTPGRMEDPGKILDLMGSAFLLLSNGLTAKVPNTGTIAAINRGSQSGILG